MTKLLGIPSDRLDEFWPFLSPELERATARSADWELVDLYERIAKRDMQLWCIMDGDNLEVVFTTELRYYPRNKVCGITHMGGRNVSKWRHHEKELMAWAKEFGCKFLEGYAVRKGWLRVLRDWPAQWTVIRKEIA